MDAPISEYTDWLASSISRYEELAKSIVAHRPEKGRVVEGIVRSALRTILPVRYSIGTGFAVTASGKISPQLDIVIYDAFQNAPIILEGGAGLFPIECIYGFVEVKSVLDRGAIKQTAKSFELVRSFGDEKNYVRFEREDAGEGGVVARERAFPYVLQPRSFIFSIRSEFESAKKAVNALRDATQPYANAFVTGLAVLQKEWFISQIPHSEPHEFNVVEGKAFARFCKTVLVTVQSMPMFPASMDKYLNLV